MILENFDYNALFENLKIFPSEKYESESLEFKNYKDENSLHNSKELAEEISALSNKNGGIIIIGVMDSSDVKNNNWESQLKGFCEIDLDTAKERIKGKIKPSIDIKLEYQEFENKKYLCIKIPFRNDTLVSTSSGKTCIREGKSSRPASPEEIERLVKTLQFYDWSNNDIDININQALDETALDEAYYDYLNRRAISESELSKNNFLESIGATKNGILNKGGLLFLGKTEFIRKYLGNYEYRFTWKKKNGTLLVNDIWSECLWKCVKRAKKHFIDCNSEMKLTYNAEEYTFHQLDDVAFHEAFLNALVHRDYSHDGMVSINFTGKQLKITSPGNFYGGINSDNIVYHEPRHRNKSLAHMLMIFQLVDRAGVGVSRIGLSSLKYGRAFPGFIEKSDHIEVIMDAEYLRTEIFVITKKYPDLGIVDLFILNSIYGTGHIHVAELEKRLKNITEKPWLDIESAMNDLPLKHYVEYIGTKNGLYISVTDSFKDFFLVKKSLKKNSTSDKHIKLYRFLKEYQSGSNEEITLILGHKHASQTSLFLKNSEYVKKGKANNSKWTFK